MWIDEQCPTRSSNVSYCFGMNCCCKWWPHLDSNQGPNDYENETPSAIRFHSRRNVTSFCVGEVSKCSRPKRKPKNCLPYRPCRPCTARNRPNRAPKSDRSLVRKPPESYEFDTAETAERGLRCIGSNRDLAVLAY